MRTSLPAGLSSCDFQPAKVTVRLTPIQLLRLSFCFSLTIIQPEQYFLVSFSQISDQRTRSKVFCKTYFSITLKILRASSEVGRMCHHPRPQIPIDSSEECCTLVCTSPSTVLSHGLEFLRHILFNNLTKELLY